VVAVEPATDRKVGVTLARTPDMEPSDDRRIAPLSDVPEDGTLLFTVREGFDEREVVLVRLADGVAAWENYCQHWTDVRFDKGSGGMVRNGELVCQKHGATFETDTGYCDFGPCEGAYLDRVAVAVHDGDVYLTDEDYEFDSLGPSEDADLSTGSPGGRIDFTGS
jgi:nitrite reductase/ring-hydroxylating ferredoxin subunit